MEGGEGPGLTPRYSYINGLSKGDSEGVAGGVHGSVVPGKDDQVFPQNWKHTCRLSLYDYKISILASNG